MKALFLLFSLFSFSAPSFAAWIYLDPEFETIASTTGTNITLDFKYFGGSGILAVNVNAAGWTYPLPADMQFYSTDSTSAGTTFADGISSAIAAPAGFFTQAEMDTALAGGGGEQVLDPFPLIDWLEVSGVIAACMILFGISFGVGSIVNVIRSG